MNKLFYIQDLEDLVRHLICLCCIISFLSKKKKLELTPLILDEVKKIMSKEDWNACVVRAKAKLEQNFIENDLIDPNSL